MHILTKKIFKKIFGNKIKININSDINNTYNWDSLIHIKLISEIEKITKKKLSISQVIQLTSVKKIDSLLIKNEKKF
jgi:acyl carrier protein